MPFSFQHLLLSEAKPVSNKLICMGSGESKPPWDKSCQNFKTHLSHFRAPMLHTSA